MNTLDNFKTELEMAMTNLSKAAGPVMEKMRTEMGKVYPPMVEAAQAEVFEKLTNPVGVINPYHQSEAEREHHKRLLALPPNLRSVVCAGIELSLAEKVFVEHGRDLSDEEAWAVKSALNSRVVSSTEELQKMVQRLSDELAPKPIKQIPSGIPWNKKVTLNGYRR